GADHVAVLELTRDSKGMLARAGAGLPDGVLGGVLAPDPSRLARDLGSESALSATIGARGRKFGVIEAHRRAARDFSQDDSGFLESAAGVVGRAARRAGG